MTRCVLRPLAQRDIEEIWDYSAATWNVDQAEAYIRQIQATLQTLARNPHLGRSCDQLRDGYRKYPSGAHVIFYRILPDVMTSYASCISAWIFHNVSSSINA